MSKIYSLGVDIGSTTVKTVILDDGKIIFNKYERHFSKVRETVLEQLTYIKNEFKDGLFNICITGSAGLGIANSTNLPFLQEVQAAFTAVNIAYPETDVVVELGGEDAKIIFLTGGVEQRMNGSCAGGTGAFIDQMATLLGITPNELDEMSLKSEKLYPIASRCGVFAKTDIQPLLNQGAKKEDISASIFQAVVDQTVSGLAQGRNIEGNVLFLGGPLSFLQGLRNAFTRTLGLTENQANFPELAPCFMAYGCALHGKTTGETFTLDEICDRVAHAKAQENKTVAPPLFENETEYKEFKERHAKFDVEYEDLKTYKGHAYLGIDAGSTTTKLVLITPEGKILYQHYCSNMGQPLNVIAKQLEEIYDLANDELVISSSAVTGYGEDLIKAGLKLDFGIVETVAHYTAASYFCPNVDFIMDIGGQDIKCFKIKNSAIDSIMLNEACSSGCGSFIQTFSQALGYEIDEFSKIGLFAKNPVELGSRCTVFMNSSVKQAQKDGATVADISAGLSSSIIKNAIYKVIRAKSFDELGENIVVQGGTFLNDAVLRSFEQELGRNVVRPSISGLMGAFGCAVYAMKHTRPSSTSLIITKDQLKEFSFHAKPAHCKGCTANCNLTVITFNDGHKFISGNRCEKGAGLKKVDTSLDLYEYKLDKLVNLPSKTPNNKRGKVGLPLVLNFFDLAPYFVTMFEELGFEVVISDVSTRDTYYAGQSTIPSDTVCYPAKLVHGHMEKLIEKNVDFIFYPCMTFNVNENISENHFNCPVVAYYPELLKVNMPNLSDSNFIHPYIDLNRDKHVVTTMLKTLSNYKISKNEMKNAVAKASKSMTDFNSDISRKTLEIIATARENNKQIIVLAGRPYHIDPEINHGIHKLVTSLGMAVLTEDSIAPLGEKIGVDVLNQWTYHARLYKTARYVTENPDMQLVQLVSFGCGIDAITTDEVRSILEEKGKLYTQLKIDEINNLGAVKIRLRSLIAAISEK